MELHVKCFVNTEDDNKRNIFICYLGQLKLNSIFFQSFWNNRANMKQISYFEIFWRAICDRVKEVEFNSIYFIFLT